MNIKTLLLLLAPLLVFASEILNFTVLTDKNRVNQGASAIVEATLRTTSHLDVPLPLFPESDSYQVVQTQVRRGATTRSSTTYINGKLVQQESEYSILFLYKIVFPEEGTVTLPGLTVSLGSETATTKPLRYTVGLDVEEKVIPPMSVSFERSKSNLYVNEQLPLTIRFKMFSGAQAELTNEGFRAVLDSVVTGLEEKFSVTVTTKQPEEVDMVINGISYGVVDMDLALMAIDTGTVSIPPVAYSYDASQRRNFNGMSMQVGPRNIKQAQSPRLTLNVIPNPQSPAGYDGIVGRVRIRSEISADSVAVGEGITVKYTLTGKMKSAAMGEITLPDLPDFEQFSPERRTIADSTDGVIFTKKEVSYMLIPRSVGEYTIPGISKVWFDPTTGEYHREPSREFTITVTPSDTPVETTTRYLTQETIQMYGDDIRYIKTELPNGSEVLKPYKKSIFLILLPLPWIALIIAMLYKLSAKLTPKDSDRTVRKGSLGRAFKELNAIEKGKSNASPAGVIEKYLLEKYKISAPSMRRDELRAELVKSGATEEAVSSILAFLDSVEMSRYSGGHSKQSLVSDAKKVLKQITKEVN